MTYIILAIVVVLVLWVIVSYNSLVKLATRSREAWADIEVQLKRRYDLIPNLVNTVKGYAAHETQAFENVTKARAAAMGASSLADKGQADLSQLARRAEAENMLSGALKSLFAVSEAYPDLKANQNFLELQRELSDTENKIQAARRFYNTNARDLTIAIETFPSNIIANMFKFEKVEFFDIPDDGAESQPVPVNF